jgi:hypothetical protein
VRPPVVADADTLFGATTRALLIYLDYHGLIHLHWSPLLLHELSDALTETGRKDRAGATNNELRMQESLPDACVATKDVQAEFRSVHGAVKSTKDTHVAATARALQTLGYYSAPSVVLVTHNLKDFDAPALALLDIDVKHPDIFLLELWRRHPGRMALAFQALREDLTSGPSARYLLERLARDGQTRTAAAMLDALETGDVEL